MKLSANPFIYTLRIAAIRRTVQSFLGSLNTNNTLWAKIIQSEHFESHIPSALYPGLGRFPMP